MPTQSLAASGPFDLATSSSFLCGFTPGSGSSGLDAEGKLVLGFLADGTYRPTVVRITPNAGGVIVDAEDDVAAQVARILSLDHDASALEAIAKRDRVVAKLLAERPGFRPVVFPSPYEAALWGVLAQRTPMRVASAIKRKLSEATKTAVAGFGQTFFPAPPPKRMLAVKSFAGISAEKLERMHGIARAALDGKLDARALRALPEEEALEELQKLRGVGAWTSRHVLFRGCGVADALPTAEPRFLRGIGEAYRLERTATLEDAARISEKWKPLRMWVAVLLVWNLSRTAKWDGPEKRG